MVLDGGEEDEQHEGEEIRDEEDVEEALDDWANDPDDAGCTQQAQEHAEELRQPQRHEDLSGNLQERKAAAALGCPIFV